MNTRGLRILNVLLNRYEISEKKELLKFLPSKFQEELSAQDLPFSAIAPLLFQHQHTLEKLHYSWLEEPLKIFPDEIKALLISSLLPFQRKGLQADFKVFTFLPSSIKNFFKTKVFQFLKIESVLPVEFLPQSELAILLQMDKEKLVEIIDFLGLYDLAAHVRKIVNPNHLKKIYTALSPKEFHFLKLCINAKEKLSSPPIEIDIAKSSPAAIKKNIHKRGLARLARALSEEHQDFVWHLAHTLDRGRGKILQEQFHPGKNHYLFFKTTCC